MRRVGGQRGAHRGAVEPVADPTRVVVARLAQSAAAREVVTQMGILGVVEYGAGSAAEAVAGHARRRAVPRGSHLRTLRGSIETVAASRRCHPRGTARPNAG